MMTKLKKIAGFLNNLLKSKAKDYSVNGLQVKGKDEVRKIAFAVDACIDVFEKAKNEKADLIIVHHGLFWKGKKQGRFLKKRISVLRKNKISLYASHLPLDLHPEYGNNAQICNAFNLQNLKKFGDYHGTKIGFKGEFEKEISMNEFLNLIKKKINKNPAVFDFGKKKIKKVAVVSGGAGDFTGDAINEGVDVYLTGESKHHLFHIAKEGKMNVVFAGHYATEVFGVKAIAKVLKKKFGVETSFIDSQTGL